MPNHETISSPRLFNTHKITGLSPNTKYVVIMSLVDGCGLGTMTTVLVETKSSTSELHQFEMEIVKINVIFKEYPLHTYIF